MKKFLSILVLAALLLTVVGISASAAAYFEQNISAANTRVTVKKSNSVKIDGVISAGEYEEYTGGYTEWYVAENASDYFEEAEVMAQSAKWYFSWDGEYLNIAATWNAGSGANQTYAGGDYYGDYAYAGTSEFIKADDFLGYGPGLNIVSSEVSPEDEAWTRTFVTISENTATGEKITGLYSGQKGQNGDYVPPHSDFDFSWNGSVVTVEYRIPVRELSETFVANKANQMFKASIVLQSGVADLADDAEAAAANAPFYGFGVRLGQFGYNSDSGNTEKGHATFRLIDEAIPQPEGPKTEAPKTEAPKTEAPKTEAPKTEAPKTEAPKTEAPKTEAPKTEAPKTEAPKTEAPKTEAPNNTPVAPNTGDIMVVAAVVSALSACGVMIAKKRK